MNKISTILKQFEKLKPDEEWSFAKSKVKTNMYSHNYHRYPAKFIPQIARKLISTYTKDKKDIVLDPFGGCGTTLVESKCLGRKSIGIDLNPIAKLISQVKITPINPIKLEAELNHLLLILKKYSPEKKYRLSIKEHERIKYWFHKSQIHELNYIYATIKKIKNGQIRKFFSVAFSHNLKNSSRWLMKSIKPTIDKNKQLQSSIKTFSRHAKLMVKKNSHYIKELEKVNCLNVSSKMYRRDATKKLPIKNNSINLIVTSPPYVISYEYIDLHQLSLLWFGSDTEFRSWDKNILNFSFKKDFIGTQYNYYSLSNKFNSDIARNIAEKLLKKNKPLANSVKNYFIDMNMAFSQMHRVLKRGGYACIIIGNTSLKDIDILNAEVAAEQMLNIGFKKVEFIKRDATYNKSVTPWRDIKTGKFTSRTNKNKKMAYQYEYVIIMQKV